MQTAFGKVLKDILSNECYFHFLCLHVASRTLLSSKSTEKLVSYSEKLLIHFVGKFEEIIESQFVSHNIHRLLHILDDYRRFGTLDNCSCFPFENYMKTLKRMIRKHEKPLEQVINRHQEFFTFSRPKLHKNFNEILYKKSHDYGPLTEHMTAPQFKIVIKNSIKIDINSLCNCYIGFENNKILSIFLVKNIYYDCSNGKKVFITKKFNQIDQYFEKPISSLKLGIALVDILSEDYVTIDIGQTEFIKYMIILHDKKINVLPIQFYIHMMFNIKF